MMEKWFIIFTIVITSCYHWRPTTGCPQTVAAHCKCRLDGGAVRVDCSKMTLPEAVKLLEDANLPVRSLDMHDNNQIRDIPAKLFSKLINVTQIDFANNYIARVDPLAFVGQEDSLIDINLSNNSLPLVPNLSLLRRLENLDLSGNTMVNIPDNAFSNNPRLKTLRLERNKICTLTPNALNETKLGLELLDLSNNCFSYVPAANLRNFQKLAYLDLGANRIGEVANLQFMNMPALKELRLNDNNINTIYPMAFMNVPNLEILNLARNKLPVLDTSRFQSFDNLAVLDLTGNKLSKVPTSAYTNMKSLRQIMLDSNNISSVETLAFSSLPQLQLISLQDNVLSQLYRNAFDSLSAMQVLLLANNRLQSLDAGMLSGMPVLQQLNLRNNSMATLQPNTLDPLPQLTTLDLGQNQLETIPTDLFKKLTKLFWLDLSQNRIKSVEPGTFTTKISNMLLQGNPWECDLQSDWFVNYLVTNNVRTFLPGQPEVVCAGPPEYAGTLLKDLMIKKANDTFFKTFGGAQGLFGNSFNNVPGLDLFRPSVEKTQGVQGVAGAFSGIATPVLGVVQTGMIGDLVKNLPSMIAGIPGKNGAPILGGDNSASVIDFSKVPPGVVEYVMNGGQIPGIPPEAMQRLIQQYLQQMSRTLPTNGSSLQSKGAAPLKPTKTVVNGSDVFTDSVPLPPLSSLPPDLVKNVMSGGLIPGMTKEQTEAIKQRYLQQMFSGQNNNNNIDNNTTNSNGSPLLSPNNNSSMNSLLSSLPPELIRSVNLSQIPPQVLTDLAAGRVPDLNGVPPDLVQILINKRPDLFGRMVDKLLQKKIDDSAAASNETGIAGRLPPTQQSPVQITGHPYDVNQLDDQADLGYFNQRLFKGNQNNMGLWTGLGLGVVGILTTATILFLCYKRRKARVHSTDSPDADGTKFFSTPKSSTNTLRPVQTNNVLPPFFAASAKTNGNSQSNLHISRHNSADVIESYCKPPPGLAKSWMFETSGSHNFNKTEM